jgi:DNA-binding transcriptional MerR regulator
MARRGRARTKAASDAAPVDHGDRLYYSIGEAARLVGVEPHILRFWETEFPTLRPKKNRAGNRAYRPRDVDLIQAIKRLLYDERFTIDGARRRLAARRSKARSESLAKDRAIQPLLAEVRTSVTRVMAMLDDLE